MKGLEHFDKDHIPEIRREFESVVAMLEPEEPDRPPSPQAELKMDCL